MIPLHRYAIIFYYYTFRKHFYYSFLFPIMNKLSCCNFSLGTEISGEGLSHSLPHTHWLIWVCLSFLVCIMGVTTITTAPGCDEVSFSYYWETFIPMPGTVGAWYIFTIINKTITMVIVTLSGFLLYSYFWASHVNPEKALFSISWRKS